MPQACLRKKAGAEDTRDRLADLNLYMEQGVELNRVNEDFLWEALGFLDEVMAPAAQKRTTLVRLTELALWCAACYADSGELTAAGDLLVNPRQKLLRLIGRGETVRLKRHANLTDQALPWCPAGRDVIDWLKDETRLVVAQSPLLPELVERVKGDEYLARSYASSVISRMEAIATTMSFVFSLRLPRGRCIEEHLGLLKTGEREFIEEKLCRFDLDGFHRFGLYSSCGEN